MVDSSHPIRLNYARPTAGLARFRLHPVITFLLTVPMTLYFGKLIVGKDGPFFHVVTGQLFRTSFDSRLAGIVLDQPTIGKWYIIFGFVGVLCALWMTFIRLISRRRTFIEQLAFAIPAVPMVVLLIVLLTLPFWWNIQYIHAMGLTPKRLIGLAYGLVGYASLLAYLAWILIPLVRAAQRPPGAASN